MAKNKLTDLNDHLFAAMERLGDEELKGEQLQEEINRSQAITKISREIISNADLILKAQVAVSDSLSGTMKPAALLGIDKGEKD
jgi:hypothetical protein